MRLKGEKEIAIESVIAGVSEKHMKGEPFNFFIRKKHGGMTAVLSRSADGDWVLDVDDDSGCNVFSSEVEIYGHGDELWLDIADDISDGNGALPPEWEWLEELLGAGETAEKTIAKIGKRG